MVCPQTIVPVHDNFESVKVFDVFWSVRLFSDLDLAFEAVFDKLGIVFWFGLDGLFVVGRAEFVGEVLIGTHITVFEFQSIVPALAWIVVCPMHVVV